MMRRVVTSASSALSLAASSQCGRGTSSMGGLAAVWQQAAHAVDAFLGRGAMPAPGSTAVLAARCVSSSAASASSSEPQRAEEQEAAPYRNCWQCGSGLRSTDMFFCPDCNSIQPPDNDAEAKFFEMMGLPSSAFEVDPDALEQRYKQLQRALHPDKFTRGSHMEKEYSDQQAALVNQAYDVLKKPLRRAAYILQQAGLGACEGLTITDPELLMYVMEAREEVEGTEDPDRLKQLLEESREQEGRCVQELTEAFRHSDLQRAAEITTQLRYIKRIQEAIIDKL